MSTLFDLAFLLAAPFWALMILLPTWRWTRRVVASPWIVAPVLVVWAVAAVPLFGPLWTVVAGPSLDGLRALVAEPGAVTLLWAQIIAWDLFIGRWMYLDGRERGVPPLVMSPLLVLTIVLSPIGLPLHLVLRRFTRGRSRT
ncbi:ABA4-like family protein [Actinophytocola sp.]|uniref:ABA4-like family protein n=1 Tax=Actinophytocola sp. TaxID=1872138 RepID=UPI002EDAB759